MADYFGNNRAHVKAFVAREARDFRKESDENWISTRVAVLEAAFGAELAQQGADYLVIESQTNLGLLFWSLMISLPNDNWSFKGGNFVFRMCLCGRFDHF